MKLRSLFVIILLPFLLVATPGHLYAQDDRLKHIVEEVCVPDGCPSGGNGISQTLERNIEPESSHYIGSTPSAERLSWVESNWKWLAASVVAVIFVAFGLGLWRLNSNISSIRKKLK